MKQISLVFLTLALCLWNFLIAFHRGLKTPFLFFYAIMNSTELYRFQRNLSFWSWRNKLREPPDEANQNPIRIKKRKGSFIMVVYQPPVLELPVPIEAYLSVNGFVCIATSVVLVVSLKYLFSGNMVNHKFLCSRFFIHRCRKCSSFPF